jgi:hypothetical protein
MSKSFLLGFSLVAVLGSLTFAVTKVGMWLFRDHPQETLFGIAFGAVLVVSLLWNMSRR